MNFSSPPPYADDTSPEQETHLAEEGGMHLIRNAWFMVYERKWYALATFVLVTVAVTLYALHLPKIFQSIATVQVLKHGAQVMHVVDVVESNITSESDLNTQIRILESISLAQSVANRLTPEESKQLIDPLKSGSGESPSPADIIYLGRKILPQRMSLILAIQFQHPDPKIAARVANLIAGEYIAYNSRVRAEESMKAVDDLRERADQQRKRVDDLANGLQVFRQRGNLISLVQSKDIVTEKLKALNMMATQANAHLKDAEVRWSQVQSWTKAHRDLAELPFIAGQAKVSALIQQVTMLNQALAQAGDRYKPKHPRWIEAANAYDQAQRELSLAIATAAASIKSEYENALQTDEEARKALTEQETKSLELDKSAVEYDNLARDFRVNELLLESMIARMRETAVSSSIETENARVIDRAFETSRPVSPNVRLYIVAGAIFGLFLGIVLAYSLAMINDGIKTAYEVEKLVGLPLIGVIPRVEKMDQPDKAQIAANHADRSVAEAYLTLCTNLRIVDESQRTRLILVTSTLPGEGKSFVTTNLALTFAAQGLRTVIVDCDLRKPSVQRSFRLHTTKGVVTYCLDGASLDEVVTKNVHPNLDVIAAGGRAKNPIRLLNSPEFETLVAELAKRYDRVVFDTPPIGAVSDALNMLPMMDGWIYTVRFNQVKLKAAQQGTRRLLATHVPTLGAVLNDMRTGAAGEHYMENQSKSFKTYYDVDLEDEIATKS